MTNTNTLAAVEQACADLTANGDTVTFAAVAERTGLSRTTLYRDDGLRAVIEDHRARSRDARTLSGLGRELEHLRTAVDTLADRVRRQEERIRTLEHRRRAG